MKRRLAGLLFPGRRYWSSPCAAAWCLTSVWGSACELRWVCIPGGHEESRVAYHLTEKSVRGVESIMVSDIPVYRRIATSVTVWIQKRANLCSASLEPRNWLMVSNIPFGLYEPEWTDYLKTFSSIFGWNLNDHLTSIRNFRNFLSNGKHPRTHCHKRGCSTRMLYALLFWRSCIVNLLKRNWKNPWGRLHLEKLSVRVVFQLKSWNAAKAMPLPSSAESSACAGWRGRYHKTWET